MGRFSASCVEHDQCSRELKHIWLTKTGRDIVLRLHIEITSQQAACCDDCVTRSAPFEAEAGAAAVAAAASAAAESKRISIFAGRQDEAAAQDETKYSSDNETYPPPHSRHVAKKIGIR